jgi:cytochrome P450
VVFGGKALKSYIPITLSFTDKDFDETLEYLESVLIEKSVSKTLREIFISECFRFHNVLKGAIIPPLEKLNPNQTYRIEKGDKVYTTIDQILADETSIGKIMNINLLK